MKSVVIETRGRTATLLSEDGRIFNVRNKNYNVGQEITGGVKVKMSTRTTAALAVVACFVMLFVIGTAAYYTPTAYVSFDVNPSIEYRLNMFDIVLSARGGNDDGSEILERIDLRRLKNKQIDEAVAIMINEIAEAGYLEDEDAGIIISTSARNMKKAERMAERLKERANEVCKTRGRERLASAEAFGRERVKEARERGVTPGRLRLVEMLKSFSDDPDFDIDEWLDKSVKEILAEIKKHRENIREEVREELESSELKEKLVAMLRDFSDDPENFDVEGWMEKPLKEILAELKKHREEIRDAVKEKLNSEPLRQKLEEKLGRISDKIEDFDLEELLDKPVREILDELKELREAILPEKRNNRRSSRGN